MTPTESFEHCRRIVRQARSNFGHAFLLLPRAQRRAMNAVYAFMRLTDDIGDDPRQAGPAVALDRWDDGFEAMLRGEYSHAIHPALHRTILRHGIEPRFFRDVIAGVRSDLAPRRLDGGELSTYCYRVAGAVGLICLPIWNCQPTPEAMEAACHAGQAFQRTNMLRDRAEDARSGRVYLDPRESTEELADEVEGHYSKARQLLADLPPPGRAIFQAMFDTYYAIFRKLKERGFDSTERVGLAKWKKLAILARAIPTRFGWASVSPTNHVSPTRKLGNLKPLLAQRANVAWQANVARRANPPRHVVIVGGGLAGLAAAVRLAPLGHRVTILESKNRLGGRAGSFTDVASGQMVDACQHVTMGCCAAFDDFCKTTGIDRFLKTEKALHFMTADRRISDFRCDPLPAPFHLSRSFARLHYFSIPEKIRIGYALQKLVRLAPMRDEPLLPWLKRQHQTPRIIELFWNVVIVSALNLRVEKAGLKYARKVFADAFWNDPRGLEVQVPTVPLGELYGERLRSWFSRYDVKIECGAAVERLRIEGNEFVEAVLRDGRTIPGNACICAVPFDRLPGLLPDGFLPPGLASLQVSPISSVHFWYDRPIMDLPHTVLVGCLGQWVFNRGEVAPGEHYVQVVISASDRSFPDAGNDAIQSAIVEEMRKLFPKTQQAKLMRCRVVTERKATFAPLPGVDDLRPTTVQRANIHLAGDYTQTGWPATMEGAVRSGYLAADNL